MTDRTPNDHLIPKSDSVPISDFIKQLEDEGYGPDIKSGSREVRKWMRKDHRILIADICLCFMLAIVALPFIVMAVNQYIDHQRHCALSVHSIPCGD